MATYDVFIDSNDDGTFAAGEEVTSDVRANPGIEIKRGSDPRAALFRPGAGTGDLVLDNTANSYGPGSAVDPGDHVRIRATHDAVTYTLFRGPIDITQPAFGLAQRITTVTANGVFAELAGRNISTALYSDVTIGTAIGHLLDAAGFPAGLRDLDTGHTTLDWWWIDEADAFQELIRLVNTEGPTAYIFEQGDGTITFRERYSLREDANSNAVQSTFRGTTTEPIYSAMVYDSHSREVIDFARIVQRERTAAASAQVWALGSTLTLGPNESRIIVARQSTGTPFQNAIAPTTGGGDYTVTSGSVSSVTLDRTSGGNVAITVTAGASGAVVTGLRMRADSVDLTAESVFESGSGTRSFNGLTVADISPIDAQGLAESIVDWANGGRPIVTLSVIAERATATGTACMAREIGDRVRVIENDTSYDSNLWVRHIHHRVTNGPLHVTTFTLEDVTGAPVYFLIGTSEIGSTDEIAPY